MTYTNCPHCGSLFSSRGLYRHTEVKHPEHAIDFKHNFIIKLTGTQRKALDSNARLYNDGVTTPEYVVKVLQEHGVIL